MNSHTTTRRAIGTAGAALIAISALSSALPAAPAQAARPGAKTFTLANGFALQAGARLPIYAIVTAPVDAASASQLANRMNATEGGTLVEDTVNRLPRYTTVQTATRAVLEQYSATGGIYLYSAARAFGETAPKDAVFDAREAQARACRYTLENELAPDSVTFAGKAIACNMDFGDTYKVSEVWRAQSGADGVETGREQIGLQVQVPLGIPIFGARAGAYPLGGPGGHISLLFDTTDAQSPEAQSEHIAPGITALAAPVHGREFRYLRDAPALDAQQLMNDIREQLMAAYPGAPITVPVPSLVYWLSDASTPQRALEPVFSFEGAGVEIDGQIVSLKSFTIPAIEPGAGGFGPSVDINSPASGSRFPAGQSASFTADVSAGVAPYSYTWTSGDGAVLGSGVLSEAGALTLTTGALPVIAHGGQPAAVAVYLTVEDAEGAIRGDSVTVVPSVAPQIYMPLAMSAAGVSVAARQSQNTRAIRAATASYGFGTEMASDYPGTKNDLPGVVPDVNGFRASMAGDGWWSGFGWTNSSVWERDFRECQLGGGDCSYGVDRVDFAYYSGHGGPASIFLPSTQSSTWFNARNARFDRIRWAAFSSCQTLRVQTLGMTASEPIREWFSAFRGAHMLLGFNTNMADVAFGGPFADRATVKIWNVLMPWTQPTIAQAWVQTAFNMNAGKPAYLYAVGGNANPAFDRMPSPVFPFMNPPVRPLPVGGWAWVWWNGAAKEFCPNAPMGSC